MKKVLAFLILAPMLACTNSNKTDTEGTTTPLSAYVDSITSAYPNYRENIVVAQKICEDFEGHLNSLPGILEHTEFRIVGISDIAGKTSVMLANVGDEFSLSVWCEDFEKEKALTLDKDKFYFIKRGEIDHYKGVSGIASPWLKLGEIYVKGLELTPAK